MTPEQLLAAYKDGERMFPRANLLGANLARAHLARADLREANLSGANLFGADLSGADLARAKLTEANLREANLQKVKLVEANLARASLVGANLAGAHLARANLARARCAGANLTGADLTGADLTGVDLAGADLTRADLAGAKLTEANLAGVNLCGVLLDCELYEKNGWSPEHLQQLVACGAVVRGLEDVLARAGRFGLELTFRTTLNRIDQLVIDAVIVGVLGRDTECRVEVFVVRPGFDETHVRISNAPPEHLLAVAAVLIPLSPHDTQREAIAQRGRRYLTDDLKTDWGAAAALLENIELNIEPPQLERLRSLDPGFEGVERFTSIKRDAITGSLFASAAWLALQFVAPHR